VTVRTADLNPLLRLVCQERDVDKALDGLSRAALELTGSRNAMIARMNDEAGVLELRHGSGDEWSSAGAERLELSIDTQEGIVSYVAATGEQVVTGDVLNDPRYKNVFGSTRSEIAVPVQDVHGRNRAVLNVECDRLDAYDEDDVQACEAISLLIGIVLERAEAERREEALIQIGSALDNAHSEDELIEAVIRVAGEVLRFQAFSLFLLDPKTDIYMLRGTVGRLKSQVGKIGHRAGEGLSGWVCETGQPVLLSNPEKDPRWRGQYVEFPGAQIASYLAVPVLFRSKCIGVIRVIRRVSENPFLDNRFTIDDQRVLWTIAEQLGTALESLRNVDKIVRAERMVAWGELSAKSSHMIGNRVFALKGDVNELQHLLAEKDLDREELLSLQKSLDVNVTRIEEILQDFRDFVTATQIEREKVRINDLVETTVREVFPRRSKVELELQMAQDLPPVYIDAKKLRRAISELVENSISFMDEGRMLVQTSLGSEEALKRLKLASGKTYVQIVIQDTGPGVQAERKSLIFQPFYSSRVKGMGLGLSIVKGIIDAHGGAVFEAGEPGAGAKFVILLPAAERSTTENQ
jgi:signal transduction histidine kinase